MGDHRHDRPVALVIGASRGLGRAAAVSLAANGFDVAVGARTVAQGDVHDYWLASTNGQTALPGSLEETAALVQSHGAKAWCVQMDLLDLDGCVRVVEKVFELGGQRLDCVVNSAIYQGKGYLTHFMDLDGDDYDKIMRCNSLTPCAIFKRAIQLMNSTKCSTGGSLVQLSSSSLKMTPKFPVDKGGWDFGYASSKSAISKLMPLLAVELPLAETKLRFFNVEPGLVVTELMKAGKLADGYTSGFGEVPPEVTGAVIAYLVTAPQASVEKFNGTSVYAPQLCEKLSLIKRYQEKFPKIGENKL